MKRRAWTEQEVAVLRQEFPHHPSREVAERIGRSYAGVVGKAEALGLKKTAEYLASEKACRIRKGDRRGASTYFKPGQSPWNKGKAHPARGRSAETQFKKGQKPASYKPLGSERISKDGLVQVKIFDTGYPPKDWASKHRVIWERENGPLPDGMIVVFKDGNDRNFDPGNLEAITRAENMARNTRHRYGPEINEAIYAKGVLTRKINQLTKELQNEKQN